MKKKKVKITAEELREMAQRHGLTAGLLKLVLKSFCGCQLHARVVPADGQPGYEMRAIIAKLRWNRQDDFIMVQFASPAIQRTYDGAWELSKTLYVDILQPGDGFLVFDDTVHPERFGFFRQRIPGKREGVTVTLLLFNDPDAMETPELPKF